MRVADPHKAIELNAGSLGSGTVERIRRGSLVGGNVSLGVSSRVSDAQAKARVSLCLWVRMQSSQLLL